MASAQEDVAPKAACANGVALGLAELPQGAECLVIPFERRSRALALEVEVGDVAAGSGAVQPVDRNGRELGGQQVQQLQRLAELGQGLRLAAAMIQHDAKVTVRQ